MLLQAFSLVDRAPAAKSALIVNRKLQEQNLGAQFDFGPVLRAVLFKRFTVSESIIEALVSSYSPESSDLLSDICQIVSLLKH